MSIAALFEEMEQQKVRSGGAGAVERRIPTQSPCDLFVRVQKPANTRALRVRFSTAAAPQARQLPEFRGLDVTHHSLMEGGSPYETVAIHAANPAFSSVFTSLAEDIARYVSQFTDEAQAAAAFFGRLLQWQRLLERQGAEGLPPEGQRGLYGELWFLREHVVPAMPLAQAVASWTGPDWTAKDFQFPGGAVEVKTTTARQHQNLQITSEKQLDDAGLAALFLCHLSIEAAQGTGETLAEAVSSLRALAAGDPVAAQLLEDRLLSGGYLDIHEASYTVIGYLHRSVSLYRIQEGFPRIIESDLRPGVGDVRYSISAAECKHYSVSAEDLRAFLHGGA